MINMKKTAVATALLLATGAANAASLASLDVAGGSFALGAGAFDAINPAAFASMSVDGVTFDGSKPLAPGANEAAYFDTSVATFNFSIFGPVGVYTAANDAVSSGYTPVTGDVTGGNLTLDLNSWTAYWNGTDFNQGSSSDLAPNSICVLDACSTAIVTTYDSLTGDFTASWDAVVVGGAFDGQVGHWNINGNAQVVPVPAAVWLFGSGLLGLVGIARRRKAA